MSRAEPRVCECGDEYTPWRRRQTHCTPECAKAFRAICRESVFNSRQARLQASVMARAAEVIPPDPEDYRVRLCPRCREPITSYSLAHGPEWLICARGHRVETWISAVRRRATTSELPVADLSDVTVVEDQCAS